MANFCSECGAAQSSKEARFCQQCGAALASGGDLNLDIRGNVSGSQITAAGRDMNIYHDGEVVTCAVCGGTGKVEDIIFCPDCDGAGVIRHRSPIRRGERYLIAEGCPTCGGCGEETCFRDRSGVESFIWEGTGRICQPHICEACAGQGKKRV
ncbi:MAG: hypothetical protein JW757_10570 [Anaerolineales bacterium]|nr:hypothetical protein [Anaerolineales bacterium]